jgi:hypothetical protein
MVHRCGQPIENLSLIMDALTNSETETAAKVKG